MVMHLLHRPLAYAVSFRDHGSANRGPLVFVSLRCVTVWLAISGGVLSQATPARAGDPTRGAALFALAGGCSCHTSETGPVGAGGGKVPTPFGTFYGTNITADRD